MKADVVVVGMGPGGEEVAGRLAEAGLDVVGVEKQLLGGECPYWGCVPSKMMLRAAGLLADGRRIDGMAGHADVLPDYSPVALRIREDATDYWNDQVAVDRFVGKGGRFVRGEGRVVAPGQVAVGEDTYEAERAIVLATGTVASIPPIEGLAEVDYWTNREAIESPEVPASLIVLGGGAIGVELGQMFARFGSEVTIVEALDRILALEEPESSELLAAALQEDGVRIVTGTSASAVRSTGNGIVCTLADGSEVSGERILVATGRRARLDVLGVGNLGVDEKQRFVPVDERMRVREGVWAVGDLTGKGLFTHMAMYQAAIAIRDILGQEAGPAEYTAVPRVTFTDPEVGSVGLTEQQARDQGLEVRIGRADVSRQARGWIHKAGNTGVIKLVEDAGAGVLVGATSVGPVGGEVLGLLALAVHARVPTSRLCSMIYAYPTFHRAIEAALGDIQGLSCSTHVDKG
jgi:pyruvate/2-oxoglutarate dehydrogenase complex dihydrolipoamide dehydrogenase (E3) component